MEILSIIWISYDLKFELRYYFFPFANLESSKYDTGFD
jgi:hypothetical protein